MPTLQEFTPRFMEGHPRANRQKPSGIAAKETILKVHLVPLLGAKRLDAVSNEDIQRSKSRLRDRALKTVNNVLAVLNTMLKEGGQMGCDRALAMRDSLATGSATIGTVP